MNDKEVVNVPYFVAEGMIDRQSKTIRRLWVMCMLLIVLLVGTNALWLYYESQFMYVEETVEQDIDTGDGDSTIIGIGDYYGKN